MKYSGRSVAKYCRYVQQAVNLGVNLEDIFDETLKYHGSEFALVMMHKIRNG